MKPLKLTKLKIKHQGAPIVNFAVIREKSRNIVCIDVDLKSKYCDIEGLADDNTVYIFATTERSLHLSKKHHVDKPTVISFPEFKGWETYAADMSKYSLSICLIRKRK